LELIIVLTHEYLRIFFFPYPLHLLLLGVEINFFEGFVLEFDYRSKFFLGVDYRGGDLLVTAPTFFFFLFPSVIYVFSVVS
jgi:hypothetical protein